MNFTPKSEEDCLGLLPEADYAFSIVTAIEENAKSSGNPQIKMTVDIYDGEGVATRLFAYLPSSGRMMFKLRHCCESVGMLKEYDSGQLHADNLIGKSGTCHVVKEPAKNGYPEKNAISDYVTDKSSQKMKPETTEPKHNDGLPF